MTVPCGQIHVRRYVSGWCGAALHQRCKGSYAGAACCCPCHQQTAPGREAAKTIVTSRGSAV